MYRSFAGCVTTITQKARELESRSATREFLTSLNRATEDVTNMTQTAKVEFAKCDALLERTQARYEYTLAKVDIRFEKAERSVSENMSRLRDRVEAPASRIAAFAAGMKGVATTFGSADSD
jgi:hypothetical protein